MLSHRLDHCQKVWQKQYLGYHRLQLDDLTCCLEHAMKISASNTVIRVFFLVAIHGQCLGLMVDYFNKNSTATLLYFYNSYIFQIMWEWFWFSEKISFVVNIENLFLTYEELFSRVKITFKFFQPQIICKFRNHRFGP